MQIQVGTRKGAVFLQFGFFFLECFSPEIDGLTSDDQRLGLLLVERFKQVKVVGKARLQLGTLSHYSPKPP